MSKMRIDWCAYDGTATRVYIDDCELKGVSRIKVVHDPGKVPLVTLTFHDVIYEENNSPKLHIHSDIFEVTKVYSIDEGIFESTVEEDSK